MRWSAAEDITPETVRRLRRALDLAYRARSGVTDSLTGTSSRRCKFEADALDGRRYAYLTTPFNRAVALDAITGREHWSYDPGAVAMEISAMTASASFIGALRFGLETDGERSFWLPAGC